MADSLFSSPSPETVTLTTNATRTSAPHENTGEQYAVLVMLAIFSFIGTVGNALVVYVFSKKNDNQTSTTFIIGLAVVDMMTCAVVLPGTMLMEYQKFYIGNDILCKAYQFLTTANVPYSAFIMTAIAIDRYLCICHPFLHAMNVPRARILITCLGVTAGVMGLIAALFHSVYEPINIVECFNETESVRRNISTKNTILDLHLAKVPCPEIETADIIYQNRTIAKWTGTCALDLALFGQDKIEIYQKVHVSTFFLCLVVVSVLYTLIYKSVLDRRRKRAKMKASTARIIANEQTSNVDCDETRLTAPTNAKTLQVTIKNGSNANSSKTSSNTLTVDDSKKLKRKSTRKDKNRMQNVRTALMLFIVTLVFVVTFLPAALMANYVIPYQGIVFYMYFLNNVVNPVIYSFMNKNFRDDLKKVFNCK